MSEPISWSTAKRTAARVAREEPFAASYLRSSFDLDLARLTREAEQLVEAETGLHADGPARIRVADRNLWVSANIDSFKRLVTPLTDKLSENISEGRIARVGRTVAGVQVGALLGWMSSRVLGQYVPVLDQDSAGEQDILYYVAPNMLSMEKRFGFPPEEFRLWIAIHECTHRAQFTAVSWMGPYMRSLIDSLLSNVQTDPETLKTAIEDFVKDFRSRRAAAGNGGLMALFATPEQKRVLERVQGLMALLEGHAEVVMSRAGTNRVPSADRFHRVIATRRQKGNPVAKFMQRALGLDAKMRQYAEGANFVRALEASGGAETVAKLWHRSENLPVYSEIRQPARWIERVGDAHVSA